MLKVNPSLIRCVLNARVDNKPMRNLRSIITHTQSLSAFFENSDKEALVRLFKRVANILEDSIEPTPIMQKSLSIKPLNRFNLNILQTQIRISPRSLRLKFL